jgi:hypothetical protein
MSATTDALAEQARIETRPLVFISHRHDDKAFADVVANFLRSRSAGQVDVYQSSDANAEGPRAGAVLSDELQTALWRASRVIFVYTSPEADWGWCLFECGLALQPDTPPTTVTVFSCGAAAPPQLAGRVLVKIGDRGDIQRFCNDFLTSRDFFPGRDRPVAAGFQENDPNVLAAANALFDELATIPRPEGAQVQEWPAYPFLQLEITATDRARLCDADGSHDQRLVIARDVLASARISDSDSEGARIFGVRRDMDANTCFGDLMDGWCDRFTDDAPPWVEALADQMMAGARWSWPSLHWVLMCSMDGRDKALYAPVLVRVRRWPDKHMQFDVEFQPFERDEDGNGVKVRVPPPDAPTAANAARNGA